MASRRKPQQDAGLPEWLVTFADLMSILVCFFVLIISFSIQDKQKLQVVAGSMREAFGIKYVERRAGMIEREGSPVRNYVKHVSPVPKETDSEYADTLHDERKNQGPEANTHDIERTDIERPRHFAVAAASLRQAWRELPEIAELSDNLLVEETPEGLHIQLVDQEGRSMFPQGSSKPYDRTRNVLAKMGPVLKGLPNRIQITGHTDASRLYTNPGYSLWDLSADRAKAARRILGESGLPHDRFHSVMGRADAEPLFPEDPFLASNRRISILVMSEAPPFPIDHKPERAPSRR
ncbi:MAG: flagellar motor protein MotB [Hyphomicrobiaceae bacterium]|nr:flagellar motor protein MotB [Hyphomicrobiaceae bacterium]